jgi:hypothetical protein
VNNQLTQSSTLSSCIADSEGHTMTLDSINFPSSNDMVTWLKWAGEPAWDIAEGAISHDVAAVILTIVIGWSDLGTESERATYRSMARKIESMLRVAA